MAPPRIYLAGPDVFLPDAVAVGAAKRAVCGKHGLVGVYPLDGERPGEAPGTREAGLAIAAANEAHMLSCDAIIANLSPFRGPSADPGTCFELGFMRALGRPCFAYSNDSRPFVARIREALGADLGVLPDGRMVGGDGLTLESFGLSDNLMLDHAVIACGNAVVIVEEPGLAASSAFARCVALAASRLGISAG